MHSTLSGLERSCSLLKATITNIKYMQCKRNRLSEITLEPMKQRRKYHEPHRLTVEALSLHTVETCSTVQTLRKPSHSTMFRLHMIITLFFLARRFALELIIIHRIMVCPGKFLSDSLILL